MEEKEATQSVGTGGTDKPAGAPPSRSPKVQMHDMTHPRRPPSPDEPGIQGSTGSGSQGGTGGSRG